jgi:NAD(P)-dependent dehydrogenase (short-subunit alcohol dehydrogenase family)
MEAAITDLTDRIALVTGASRGLGHAAALAFARAGAHVCALARTQGGLEELDEEIRPGGGAATLIPLDIRDEDGLARLGAALYERFGRLDLWLHTAAYAPPLSPAEHAGAKELDEALATNVRALQRLIRVLDPLLRQGEAPVALVAGEGCGGRAFHGLYDATKAAQSALVQAWAAEAAARITVAEVLPPPMATAVRGRFHPGEDRSTLAQPDAVAERLLSRLPEAVPGARLAL